MQFNKDELKQILVNTKDYERNDYLDKYVNLIWENREQIRIKYFTQKHHFIPVSHYGNSSGAIERKKVEKIADADSFNFRINLLYKDHILAHYYLSKCAITYKAISSNCKALRNILRNNIYQKNSNYIAEKELLLKLEDIQQAYVKGAKAYELSLTEEQKKTTLLETFRNSKKSCERIYGRRAW